MINGAKPPPAMPASVYASEEPAYRTRVGNCSVTNAACGPYMAPWITRPMTTAITMSAGRLLSSRTKKTKAQSIPSSAPAAYTGRRPTRSERAPKKRTDTALQALPTTIAVSASVPDRLRTVVTYVSVNTTTSAYRTSEPTRTPAAISKRRQ